jgi:hypothetical protein
VLPTSDQEWLTALSVRHDAEMGQLTEYDNEYELRSTRCYIHPEILRELEDRLQQVVVAWPLLVVGSLEERIDLEGFRLSGSAESDKEMSRVWQANNADEESQLAHVDALVMRRSYICVGANEDDRDTPLETFESPLEMYADVDPRNRKVRAALRRWCDFQDSLVRLPERYSTLYLPDRTVHYEYGANGWNETGRDEHRLGTVPVVPLVNRARLSDRLGRSELDPILPLSRAVNKLATDMMLAADFVAIPLRGFLGIGPDGFEDKDGNKLTALQAMMGRVLAIPGDADAVKQFEFAAAQLSNFTGAIDKLAALVASVGGLPPHYLGMTTDNPPSADAIRSNEARLVKRAERRHRAFGGPHEQGQRLIRRFQEGDWDPALRQLEAIWRDASTPTIAQRADAGVKLYSTPNGPIVPLRQTREDLGYTPPQIERMEEQDDQAANADAARQASIFKLPTAADQLNQPPVPAPAPAPVPAVTGAAG